MLNQLIQQRYEVVEKPGETTLFTLFKAEDRVEKRPVTFKTLREEWRDDTQLIEGLAKGFSMAATLKHPNIQMFYDWINTPYGQTAVSEYVRGMDLKERIRRLAPITLSVAVDIACSVVEALSYAHNLQFPHGDIRPYNITVSPEGAVKVCDFGVMMGVCTSSRAQNAILQKSAPYHAPELSTTIPGTVAGDIYAMGCVLYEMLTGATVYIGETTEAIHDLHAFAPIPSPRVLNSGVPRSAEGIIIKCLQKNPEDRYLTASELLTDLKSVRDALRFGKPLQWSPIDLDKIAPEKVTRPTQTPHPVVTPTSAVASNYDTKTRDQDMPTSKSRSLREERVPSWIKGAIGGVTAVIIACMVGGYVFWNTYFTPPKTVKLPSFVGMTVSAAKTYASQDQLHLLLHGDYTDKPVNVIYKTDQDPTAPAHAGQYINAWYSEGSYYVKVPDVKNMNRDDAEQALQNANLVVGTLTPEYSSTVPVNSIISQDVSSDKRVLHGTHVDLTYSEGPQPGFDSSANSTSTASGSDTNSTSSQSGNSSQSNASDTSTQSSQDTTATPSTQPSPATSTPATHTFNLPVTFHATATSGPGPWEVKITYKDDTGTHDEMDAMENEGDKVNLNFPYVGNSVRLRIYYNDSKVFDQTISAKKSGGQSQ